MADESMRAGESVDADERASQDEPVTAGGTAGAQRASTGRRRAGRPRRRLDRDGDDAGAAARTIERKHTTAPTRRPGTARKRSAEPARRRRTTPWAFAKQSVGELRKVIWPSGQDVSQYFVVVLVFVVLIMAVVAGLDFGFAKLLLKLFG